MCIRDIAYIDRRAAARTFADGLSSGIETVCLGVREERIGFDQLGGHPHNARKELVRIRLTAFNLHQSVFPFRRHGGGSNLFGQDAYKVVAVLCRHERFAPALNKAAFDQLFNDTGAGGGSAKPFLFGIIVELSIPAFFPAPPTMDNVSAV